MRILFVTSNGGHLDQLARLRPWWSVHDRQWVVFDKPDARSVLDGETRINAFHPTTRNIPNALRNLRLAWTVLRQQRPDVIISAGAGVAVPFFVLGRLRGIPTVFLEVYDRIENPTMTGRMVRPFSNALLLQWPEQQAAYGTGEVFGQVYS